MYKASVKFDYPNAEDVAETLGGKKAGTSWSVCCPAHDDQNPSMSISEGQDGRLLFYCHAGCTQDAVISALKDRGLWSSSLLFNNHRKLSRRQRPIAQKNTNQEQALKIWNEAETVVGSLSETYLKSRKLILPNSENLRHHPALWHQSKVFLPALIARVEHAKFGHFVGIHRTYLSNSGDKKATANPNKAMLGPCKGGVVKLGPYSERILIGEGIETCLSAMQASGVSAWAALSTSGLNAVELPDKISNVTILADGDDAGERAAENCARNLYRKWRRITVARPPSGKDFNDILCESNISHLKSGE